MKILEKEEGGAAMKKCWLSVLVLVGLAVACVTYGQERKEGRQRPRRAQGDALRKLELRERTLDIEEREAEMDFRRQMRKADVEGRRLELERKRAGLHGAHKGKCRGSCGGHKIILAVCVIIHILLAIWVYQDIRKRNAGSGTWIVLMLLTGLLGALVYAVVRIGDKQQA